MLLRCLVVSGYFRVEVVIHQSVAKYKEGAAPTATAAQGGAPPLDVNVL